MQNKPALQQVLQHPRIWQGASPRGRAPSALCTGFPALNRLLHLGGWPTAGCCELLLPTYGLGEMQLLMPVLSSLSQQHHLLLLAPPWLPLPSTWLQAGVKPQQLLWVEHPDTAERLWACEQAIKSGCVRAVLFWPGRESLNGKQLRRLQLGASDNGTLLFLFRHERFLQHPSAAILRLHLQSAATQTRITVQKQPAGWSGQSLSLPLQQAWQVHDIPVPQWPIPSVQQPAPTAASIRVSATHPAPFRPVPTTRAATLQ